MLSFRGYAAACVLAALCLRSSPAAQPAAGTASITGRVENAAIGRYLPNARVSLKGTDVVTFTDDFGVYRLPDVPAGNVVLEIFYTGLEPQSLAIESRPASRSCAT